MALTALSQAVPPTREPAECESLKPNLHLATHYLGTRDKRTFMLDYVLERTDQSGIIYCSTRKDVETLQGLLVAEGVRTVRYHAGLADDERRANQDAFLSDEAPVIVATNASDLGMNKRDIRYTIHYNMPESLEVYWSEASRAGGDGASAESVLLWNDTDITTNRFFLERAMKGAPASDGLDVAGKDRDKRLRAMSVYCMTADCLRGCLVRYFGSGASVPPRCGACSNCDADERPLEVTELAFAVMRCVHEMRGSFGKAVVVDVLRGARGVKLEEAGLYGLASYGTVKAPALQLRVLIELMIARGFLVSTEGNDPMVGYGPRWKRMTEPGFELRMKRIERPKR